MSDTTRIMINTRLDPGVQLNDTYEIDERIASGGMGEVYRGHNIQTGEPVAIKAILPELADKEAITALFKKATTLGRLHHDTIVRYYSFSTRSAPTTPTWRWSSSRRFAGRSHQPGTADAG